ncbi:hypothetical protein ADK47_10015 [Streptomyces rimosus subsp. rimosus]|uniref:Uncharacterized protein n=1 Tax=Streptomyces rimosus subsp. rimosus TaxID=132474 RepID=A0ABY3ZEV8_STRRM|nr:hypothetical protein [Streptomyces rimosus]KOG82030.1 hypothetical protein ADK78_03290 [Kitasatospora aureofaciens]KOT43202.1 hypothetical protein ADK84_08975 [Streptomyces sp. NRRL WC-3701]KOT63777.1 hypothetical protein ADK45_14250 [Streptomyces rimosus subsp. rimosus]KOT63803.1 hypothetical protein ADK44_10360 [Streptomyces rimosus subsp. rimosus]KOT82466.1 hypothetical protein ADK47_10015 [Streptomyces rimosus subsp. rimosus]
MGAGEGKERVVDTGVRRASRAQDAVRLLFLLDRCGAPCGGGQADEEPQGAVAVVRGQKRLQALDFWLRNPDYLADELLNQVEAGKVDDTAWSLERADALLQGDEPEISRYPMVRWRFGAWEALDDALGLLYAHGLIDIVPVGEPPTRVDRWDYYLLPAGREMAAELRTAAADLAWYDERAVVVLAVAGQSSGSQLKALQYAQAEYERTVWKASISGITDRVRERLAQVTKHRVGAGG